MRKRFIRVCAVALVALATVFCGAALGACSSDSPEEAIRKDLTTNLDRIKNLDDEAIQEVLGSMDTSSLEEYGIDGSELVGSLLDGFDYEVDSVTASGDTGTAQVSITCKSATDLYDALEDVVSGLMSDPDFLSLAADQDALNARVGELFMQAFDSLEPSTKQIELTYAKVDGTWKMDGGSTAALGQIFMSSDLPQDASKTDAVPDAAEEEPAATPDASISASATVSQQNALKSAQSYLSFSNFSYDGLIGQLEFEKYSTEDATWAADNCGADWNEQALGSAQNYLESLSFSYTGLIDQLEFDGFTTEQATYGADSCGADWNEQAAKSAENYLDTLSFSRDGLIDQLEFEGFTHEQAVYGVDSVGL